MVKRLLVVVLVVLLSGEHTWCVFIQAGIFLRIRGSCVVCRATVGRDEADGGGGGGSRTVTRKRDASMRLVGTKYSTEYSNIPEYTRIYTS